MNQTLRSGARVLAATTLLLAGGASAEESIRLGVYGADPVAAMVWSCSSVENALVARMTTALEHEPTVTLRTDADYAKGVEDIMAGTVDVARFPNVPTHWVVHPSAPAEALAAWRVAVTTLEIEGLVERARVQAANASAEPDAEAALAVVEASFGPCVGSGMHAAVGGRGAHSVDAPGVLAPVVDLASALLDLIESMPATAAGADSTPGASSTGGEIDSFDARP